jgi:hypothetical protein
MFLAIKVDATDEIGAGHAMRCATLAQAWIEEGYGEAVFCGDIEIPFVRDRFLQIGLQQVPAITGVRNGVLVVDSYSPETRYETLRQRSAKIAVIVDDVGGPVEGYDVVWNPNAYRADDLYVGFSGRLITQAVPVRPGLPRWRPVSTSVGVTLGATRPREEIVAAIDKWASSTGRDVRASPAKWLPKGWTTTASGPVWDELAGCSMLIGNAGTTIWEAAAIGIPTCVMVTAENQLRTGQWAAAHGGTVIDALKATESELICALARSAAVPLPSVENAAPRVCALLYECAR